jgi:hypothetical protein
LVIRKCFELRGDFIAEDCALAALHYEECGADYGWIFAETVDVGGFWKVWVDGLEHVEFPGHVVGFGGDWA